VEKPVENVWKTCGRQMRPGLKLLASWSQDLKEGEMGYAARQRKQFWWWIWTLPWWDRLKVAWSVAKRRGTFARSRDRFQGQFWIWARGARLSPEAREEERVLRRCAASLKHPAQLEWMLAHIAEADQRALVRMKIAPFLRFDTPAVDSGHVEGGEGGAHVERGGAPPAH
jgi:hypothetical protein